MVRVTSLIIYDYNRITKFGYRFGFVFGAGHRIESVRQFVVQRKYDVQSI